MADTIYNLPPIVYGSKVYMANEISDTVDWGLKAQAIEQAWVTKGEGIVVGVADTGLPNHLDLDGAVIASQNFSQSQTVNDLNGHATHVCGTLCARENGLGVIGVAPKCSLVIAKVLDESGSTDIDRFSAGIDWLVDQNVHIISLSIGGEYHDKLKASIDRATSKGIFIVCAAGNNGAQQGSDVSCPACFDNTLAVASYNQQGTLSVYSSRGAEVDIACPGENILSTWLGNSYRRLSGTSMATPFAAGLVAELLSQQKKALSEGKSVKKVIATMADLVEHVKTISVDKGPIGYDQGWGWGIIDTEKFFEITRPPVLQTTTVLGKLTVTHPVVVEGQTGWFIRMTDNG